MAADVEATAHRPPGSTAGLPPICSGSAGRSGSPKSASASRTPTARSPIRASPATTEGWRFRRPATTRLRTAVLPVQVLVTGIVFRPWRLPAVGSAGARSKSQDWLAIGMPHTSGRRGTRSEIHGVVELRAKTDASVAVPRSSASARALMLCWRPVSNSSQSCRSRRVGSRSRSGAIR